MGMFVSAHLMYGVVLPREVEEEQVDEVIGANPYLAGIGHSFSGSYDHSRFYLVAYFRSSDLCEPEAIPADELHPVQTDNWDARLRVAWGALSGEPMPEPGWILISDLS